MTPITTTHDVVTTMVTFAMKQRKETQTDLGKALGLSNNAVSSRLRGRTRWSVDDIDMLAGHFGIDAAALVAGQLDARAMLPVERVKPVIVSSGSRLRRRLEAVNGGLQPQGAGAVNRGLQPWPLSHVRLVPEPTATLRRVA